MTIKYKPSRGFVPGVGLEPTTTETQFQKKIVASVSLDTPLYVLYRLSYPGVGCGDRT